MMTGDLQQQHLRRWLLWFTFINALLLISIAQQYPLIGYWPEDFLPKVYWLLESTGHFVFLSFALALPVLIITRFYPSTKFIQSFAVLLFAWLIVLIQIDVQIFSLYRFHLNSMVWSFFTQGAAAETFVFDRINFIIMGGGLIVILLIEIIIARFISKIIMNHPHLHGKKLAGFMLSILLIGQIWHIDADARHDISILRSVSLIPWPIAITARKLYPKVKTKPRASSIINNNNVSLFYPKNKLHCHEDNKPLNIVFIVIDSWRFDMFSADTTPNIYQFSEGALVFNHHMSTGNSTRYGMFGLFSGLLGNYWHSALRNQSGSVLIKELKQRNYDFSFFTSARITSPEFDRTIFADIKNHIPEKTEGEKVVDRDIKITQDFINYLNNRKTNSAFMSLVFYDAAHAYAVPDDFEKPFKPSLEDINYLKLNNETDPRAFKNRYKNAVYFDDSLIADLFKTLNNKKLLDNTVVVVTGDHGQEFNETHQNFWGHNSNFSRYQVQVPLIIHWPHKRKKIFNHTTSHADVVPTLMTEMLHCDNNVEDYSNGQSLFNEQEKKFVVASSWSNYSVIQPEQTTVYQRLGIIEHYNKNYQLLDKAISPKDVSLAVLEELSRFRKP